MSNQELSNPGIMSKEKFLAEQEYESQCKTCTHVSDNFIGCEYWSVGMKNAAAVKGKSCEGYTKV